MMIDTYDYQKCISNMEFNKDLPHFSSLLNHKTLKQVFEFSPLFIDMFEASEYANGGFWNEDIWYYDDPKIQEYFMCFCDGYTQGIVEYYLAQTLESEEADARMKLQCYEKDTNEEIVIDFSQYLK